jgi:ribosomal protein S18 acetylase RimI-like enzyme
MAVDARPIARPATDADVIEIARICKEGWRNTYRDRHPRQYIEQVIAESHSELFVLYADPTRRRRGGGTEVLRFLTDRQRRRGAREQWVSVEPENTLGLSFYCARGFTERGRRPAYRGDRESLRLAREIYPVRA